MPVPFRRIAISPGLLLPDTPLSVMEHQLSLWARESVRAGADALMLREHALQPSLFSQAVTRLHPVAEALQVPLLLNAAYVLKDWHPAGLHHRADVQIPLPESRTYWIGRSCHHLEDALRAQQQGYDYLTFSPIFPTASHPHHHPLGLDALESVCSALRIPVFALGGVTLAREVHCHKAGAWGIASIRGFLMVPTV
ncbi:MAG: thiamine phosphate synthase [Bacteroidetes bacterium]|nr:thiamine phosphate synthase [Bacteroidota bacterium]